MKLLLITLLIGQYILTNQDIEEVVITDLAKLMTTTIKLYMCQILYVPESMQDTVQQQKIEEEKLTDEISTV